MSAADVHRSIPGYVYGVAVACSRQEEGTPPCACPCHVANRPSGAKGWYCNLCYSGVVCCDYPAVSPVAYSHEQAIADGRANPRPYMVNVPDYYFITKGNTLRDELGEHFDSKEDAETRVKELNDADAIASLKVPRTHKKRFDRYLELHDYFGWFFYDGKHHPLTRLPRKPGRYAVESYGDGSSYWQTCETLEEVRDEIKGGDIERVVDLDTGEDVPFTVSVYINAESKS